MTSRSGGRPRRIVRQPAFARDIERIRQTCRRADEAIAGWEHFVSRRPELGMAVPGRPNFYQRPFTTDDGAFTVIYTFDEQQVICLAVRQVPMGPF